MNIEGKNSGADLRGTGFSQKSKSSSKSFFSTLPPGVPGTLTTFTTVLAIMSTIVGGGMVSIPWAFYNSGFYLAILFSIFASAQVILCSVLFLKARDLCPEKPSSMFELGFITLGRSSIFWICFIILVNSFGLLIIFFNVFGDTTKDAMTQVFWSDVSDEDANFGMKRACWVISLAVLITPFVF